MDRFIWNNIRGSDKIKYIMDKQIIEDTLETIKLPIDQTSGIYDDNETACCVGARLAGFFGLKNYFKWYRCFRKRNRM